MFLGGVIDLRLQETGSRVNIKSHRLPHISKIINLVVDIASPKDWARMVFVTSDLPLALQDRKPYLLR